MSSRWRSLSVRSTASARQRVQELAQRAVEERGALEVREMADARQQAVFGARDRARQPLDDCRCRDPVALAGEHEGGAADGAEALAAVEGDEAVEGGAVGRRRQRGHAGDRALDAARIGVLADQAANQRGRDFGGRLAALEGLQSVGEELFLPLAARTAEGGGGGDEHQRRDAVRHPCHELLCDHPAHRVTDDDRALDASCVEQRDQRIGERRERHRLERRAFAVTRHVPGDGAVLGGEALELSVERAMVRADAVQEHQRSRSPATLHARRERAQASSPCSRPSSTTIRSSRRTVQLRSGRSKWPSVCRPADSLAPVEYRKLPAKARSSVPLKSPRSYIAIASQRAAGFMPQPTWLTAYASRSPQAAK